MVKGARPMRRRRRRGRSGIAAAGLAVVLLLAIALGVTGMRLRAGPVYAEGQPATDPVSALAEAAAPPRVHQGMHRTFDQFTVHVPTGAREPLTVLVALHG